MPLLTKFWDKGKLWKKLWLSIVGRANLVKMILMPQLLKFLHNAPIVLSLRLFWTIN